MKYYYLASETGKKDKYFSSKKKAFKWFDSFKDKITSYYDNSHNPALKFVLKDGTFQNGENLTLVAVYQLKFDEI